MNTFVQLGELGDHTCNYNYNNKANLSLTDQLKVILHIIMTWVTVHTNHKGSVIYLVIGCHIVIYLTLSSLLTCSVSHHNHSPRERPSLLLTELTCSCPLQAGPDHSLHPSVDLRWRWS